MCIKAIPQSSIRPWEIPVVSIANNVEFALEDGRCQWKWFKKAERRKTSSYVLSPTLERDIGDKYDRCKVGLVTLSFGWHVWGALNCNGVAEQDIMSVTESLVIYVNFSLGNFLASKSFLHYAGAIGFGVCLKGSFIKAYKQCCIWCHCWIQ